MEKCLGKTMLPHINLSVDIEILGAFTFMVLMSMLLGHEKVRAFALSVYVGMVLAYEFGNTVAGLTASHGLNSTPGQVRLVLFTLPILMISLFAKRRGKHKHSRGLMTFILGLSVSALIVASVIHLMDSDAASHVLSTSQAAGPIFKLRLVWLGLVPIVTIADAFVKPKNAH